MRERDAVLDRNPLPPRSTSSPLIRSPDRIVRVAVSWAKAAAESATAIMNNARTRRGFRSEPPAAEIDQFAADPFAGSHREGGGFLGESCGRERDSHHEQCENETRF